MDDHMQLLGTTGFGLKFPLHSKQVFMVGWKIRQVGTAAESPASFCVLQASGEMHWPFCSVWPAGQQIPFEAGVPSKQVRQTPEVGLYTLQPGVKSRQNPVDPRNWPEGQILTETQFPKTFLKVSLQEEQRPRESILSQLLGHWMQ